MVNLLFRLLESYTPHSRSLQPMPKLTPLNRHTEESYCCCHLCLTLFSHRLGCLLPVVTGACHFQYLNREEPHRDETHPAVERVEIWDRPCGIQIVRVQNCDESHHNAWDGQCMEYCVEQLHIDPATAAAHAVQQYR